MELSCTRTHRARAPSQPCLPARRKDNSTLAHLSWEEAALSVRVACPPRSLLDAPPALDSCPRRARTHPPPACRLHRFAGGVVALTRSHAVGAIGARGAHERGGGLDGAEGGEEEAGLHHHRPQEQEGRNLHHEVLHLLALDLGHRLRGHLLQAACGRRDDGDGHGVVGGDDGGALGLGDHRRRRHRTVLAFTTSISMPATLCAFIASGGAARCSHASYMWAGSAGMTTVTAARQKSWPRARPAQIMAQILVQREAYAVPRVPGAAQHST